MFTVGRSLTATSQKTATSLQRPFFLADSPYVDSCLRPLYDSHFLLSPRWPCVEKLNCITWPKAAIVVHKFVLWKGLISNCSFGYQKMGKQLFRFIGRHAQQRKSNCKSIFNFTSCKAWGENSHINWVTAMPVGKLKFNRQGRPVWVWLKFKLVPKGDRTKTDVTWFYVNFFT